MILIKNQAELITVKPRTKLIEIGTKIFEVGYHYKKFIGKKQNNREVFWY